MVSYIDCMFVSIVVVDLFAELALQGAYGTAPPQNATELNQWHWIGQTIRQHAQNIAKADLALQVQPLPKLLQIILERIYAAHMVKNYKKK